MGHGVGLRSHHFLIGAIVLLVAVLYFTVGSVGQMCQEVNERASYSDASRGYLQAIGDRVEWNAPALALARETLDAADTPDTTECPPTLWLPGE